MDMKSICLLLVILDVYKVIGGSIRLKGGIQPDRGIVEISKDGLWSTVCNNGYNDTDAKHICSILGFPRGGKVISSKQFDVTTDDVFFGVLQCNDSVNNITDCYVEVSDNGTCHEMAAVWCFTEENSIILVDGKTPNEGRIEIFHNNSIGTICDDYFGNKEADVACNMIGYRFGGIANRRASFGQGDGQILLDNVKCLGTESSIVECKHNEWSINDCNHREDVGVTCYQGQWGQWSSCTSSCGGGTRTRFVECGRDVTLCALDMNIENCSEEPCPIHGGWSEWSNFSDCSATCGSGIRTRQRFCDNPPPSYNGSYCAGNSEDTDSCDLEIKCPVAGGWGNWSSWSDCSVTCENGTISRSRECNNPKPAYNGTPCEGNVTEITECFTGMPCRDLEIDSSMH